MIRRFSRRALWVVLAAICASPGNALDPERVMSQYVRDSWGSDRGLMGEVRGIAQSQDGYLWIGTERGLFRFDGLTFRPMSDQGASPVSLANVAGLMIGPDGSLMVRLLERNLLRYADGKFENTLYPLEPRELAVTAMCRGKDGDILVTGIVHGVMKFSKGRFEKMASAASLPPSPVISMTQSADGKIWLGTREAGLFYLDGQRAIAVRERLPSRKINSLLSTGADVWVGTDAGMARWNGTEITSEGVPSSLSHAPVLAMLTDRQSNLWVGTSSNLFRVNAAGASVPENRIRGAGSPVSVLVEDREGNLWAGGPWGIERWRDSNFTSYGKPEGLPSDHNGPIHADSGGRTWFAPLEGGLYWLSRGQGAQVAGSGLITDIVYSIGGKNGDLWIGTRRSGLTHLHYLGGGLTTEVFTQADGLAQNSVYSVYQTRDGTVWAGTLSGGVSRYRSGKFTTYSIASGLASNAVTSMLETPDGTMWFATPNGLRSLSHDRWGTYTVKEGLPSDDVNCLIQDSRGILWIGTAAGLAFLSAGGVERPRGAPETLHDPVFGLAEDKTGWLWIATSSHVVRVNRDKLLRGVLAEGDLREYAIGDGLRSEEGVRRDRSVVTDPLGRIWLSMTSGISVVDPAQLTNSSVPAIVQIQMITADNSPIDLHGTVRIPAAPRRITIGFSGVSLWEPERVRFRYRLDGYDRDWREPTSGRDADYTNLGPGPYRFRVLASNADGIWNSDETTIAFYVLPRYWQTGWFLLLALLAAGCGVLALYRIRVHQLAGRLNIGFEERLAERTRIAQELHDTLLQGFLSASMHLHVAVDNLPEESPERRSLSKVLERMRQVIDEGRNAVRGLRSSNSATLDLEQAFSQIVQELQVSDEIEFRVIVDGDPRPLHPAIRDDVYRIGREALVNGFRHSEAKEIDLEIQYASKQMRVMVRDNGRGIDPQVLESGREGHWGLPGMRERAEKIGGHLRVWSRVSGGTEVELTIPAKIAFRDSSSNQLRKLFGSVFRK